MKTLFIPGTALHYCKENSRNQLTCTSKIIIWSSHRPNQFLIICLYLRVLQSQNKGLSKSMVRSLCEIMKAADPRLKITGCWHVKVDLYIQLKLKERASFLKHAFNSIWGLHLTLSNGISFDFRILKNSQVKQEVTTLASSHRKTQKAQSIKKYDQKLRYFLLKRPRNLKAKKLLCT